MTDTKWSCAVPEIRYTTSKRLSPESYLVPDQRFHILTRHGRQRPHPEGMTPCRPHQILPACQHTLTAHRPHRGGTDTDFHGRYAPLDFKSLADRRCPACHGISLSTAFGLLRLNSASFNWQTSSSKVYGVYSLQRHAVLCQIHAISARI